MIREEYYGTGNVSSKGPVWNTAGNTTKTNVSTGKCVLLSIDAQNSGAAVAYLHFYNAAAANVTVGTTTPKKSYMLPAGGGKVNELNLAIEFSTACSFAITSNAGASGSTGVTNANEVVVNVEYFDKF